METQYATTMLCLSKSPREHQGMITRPFLNSLLQALLEAIAVSVHLYDVTSVG